MPNHNIEKAFTNFAHHFMAFKYNQGESLKALRIIQTEEMRRLSNDDIPQYKNELLYIPFENIKNENIPITYLYGNEAMNSFIVGCNSTIAHIRIGEEFLPDISKNMVFQDNKFVSYFDQGNKYLATSREILNEEDCSNRIEVVSFRYIVEED
jgi:hypothetical protein